MSVRIPSTMRSTIVNYSRSDVAHARKAIYNHGFLLIGSLNKVFWRAVESDWLLPRNRIIGRQREKMIFDAIEPWKQKGKEVRSRRIEVS